MSVFESFPDQSIRVGSDRIDVLSKSSLEELQRDEKRSQPTKG